MIQITETIAIDDDELEESFIRASGPGGQHVNRVATAVELRFDVDASPGLTAAVRGRLKRLAGNRMTNNGVLVIKAERFRSQGAQSRRCPRAPDRADPAGGRRAASADQNAAEQSCQRASIARQKGAQRDQAASAAKTAARLMPARSLRMAISQNSDARPQWRAGNP